MDSQLSWDSLLKEAVFALLQILGMFVKKQGLGNDSVGKVLYVGSSD